MTNRASELRSLKAEYDVMRKYDVGDFMIESGTQVIEGTVVIVYFKESGDTGRIDEAKDSIEFVLDGSFERYPVPRLPDEEQIFAATDVNRRLTGNELSSVIKTMY